MKQYIIDEDDYKKLRKLSKSDESLHDIVNNIKKIYDITDDEHIKKFKREVTLLARYAMKGKTKGFGISRIYAQTEHDCYHRVLMLFEKYVVGKYMGD